jgi:hypothetical protein
MRQLIEVGVSAFKLMAWSHFLALGNHSESFSEKMLPNLWYCLGTSSSQVHSLLSVASSVSCWVMVVFFIVAMICCIQGECISGMGIGHISVSVSTPCTLPIGQSTIGLAASKKGYPKIMLSSPMSATKNLWG